MRFIKVDETESTIPILQLTGLVLHELQNLPAHIHADIELTIPLLYGFPLHVDSGLDHPPLVIILFKFLAEGNLGLLLVWLVRLIIYSIIDLVLLYFLLAKLSSLPEVKVLVDQVSQLLEIFRDVDAEHGLDLVLVVLVIAH